MFRAISGLKWRLKISRNILVRAHDSLRQLVPSTSPMNVRDSTHQSPTVLLGPSRPQIQRLRRSWVPWLLVFPPNARIATGRDGLGMECNEQICKNIKRTVKNLWFIQSLLEGTGLLISYLKLTKIKTLILKITALWLIYVSRAFFFLITFLIDISLNYNLFQYSSTLSICIFCIYKGLSTWRWGLPGRWGNFLKWGTKRKENTVTTTSPRGALSQDYWTAAIHVNNKKKWLANDVLWRLMLFYSHLLLLLQPYSAVAFCCHYWWWKPRSKGSWREFYITRVRPQMRG